MKIQPCWLASHLGKTVGHKSSPAGWFNENFPQKWEKGKLLEGVGKWDLKNYWYTFKLEVDLWPSLSVSSDTVAFSCCILDDSPFSFILLEYAYEKKIIKKKWTHRCCFLCFKNEKPLSPSF